MIFGSGKRGKRNFLYTPDTKTDKKLPLEQRIRFTSLSSFDRQRAKKKQTVLLILLFIVAAAIGYLGFKELKPTNIEVDIKEIEKVEK